MADKKLEGRQSGGCWTPAIFCLPSPVFHDLFIIFVLRWLIFCLSSIFSLLYYLYLLSSTFYLPSSISCLLSSILYLLSSILYHPFYISYFLCSIFALLSSMFHLLSSIYWVGRVGLMVGKHKPRRGLERVGGCAGEPPGQFRENRAGPPAATGF